MTYDYVIINLTLPTVEYYRSASVSINLLCSSPATSASLLWRLVLLLLPWVFILSLMCL